MKRLTIILLFVALPLFTSCDKRLFHFVVDFDEISIFQVDENGAFEMSEFVSADEIKNAVEVPSDGVITGVDIQQLEVWVELREGNEAGDLILSGEIIDLSGGRDYMFRDYSVDISYPNAPFIGINSLISLGIIRLQGKIESYLLGLGDSGYYIRLSGRSEPQGQRIAVDIFLAARATVKYDQCLDVPSGFMGGDDCTIESGDTDSAVSAPPRAGSPGDRS